LGADPGRTDGRATGDAVTVRCEIGCRRFNRHAKPADLTPVFYKPNRRLTCPVEARDVLRVDGQRRVFRSVQDADPVLGQQAPHLTGAKVIVPNLWKSKRSHAEPSHRDATRNDGVWGRSGDEAMLPPTAVDRR